MCEQLSLLHIVGDECLQRVVAIVLEPTLDEVFAATPVGWDVGYSDDAIHPLSEQDSLLAAAKGVAGELDAMPSATAAVFYVEHLVGLRSVRHAVGGRGDFRSERSHERWLQVAVTGNVRIVELPECICAPWSEGL